MLKNYLKVALRHVRRHKGYVALNVSGLAIGMACCILILLYVQHEWSYDRFHEHADRIYRLVTEVKAEGRSQHYATAPMPLVSALNEVPNIQKITTLGGARRERIQQNGITYYQDGIAWADASVFEVFSFPLLKGNPETALVEPFTVVLTEALAQKLFGEDEPVGQTVTIDDRNYTVTGILAPIPSASHWSFSALTSEASLQVLYSAAYDRMISSWTSRVHTYLLLPEPVEPRGLEARINARAEQLREGEEKTTYTFRLQPLTDIHLHSNLVGELSPPGDIRRLYVFSTIALLILLVACINFMNLATARSSQRAREVGVRKFVGAQRRQLVGQFLGEAMLTSGIGLFFAVLLIDLLLPVFNGLIATDLVLDYRNNGTVLLGLAGTVLLTGLIAGSYPAFFLSSFKPIHTLRNRSRASQHGALRKSLVVAQFTVSTVFLVGTGVIYSQIDYIRHKDLGFTREHILTLTLHEAAQYEAFKQALLQEPGILSVTASMGTPGLWAPDNAFNPTNPTDNEAIHCYWIGVDADFLDTYEIDLVEGRGFDTAFASDATDAFLLNETAVRELGWNDPIGRTVHLELNNRSGTVIGVVKDFHHASLHEPIAPLLLYRMDNVFLSTISIRIRPDDVARALAFLEKTWETFQPQYPFEYRFLDDEFAALYAADTQFARICSYVSLLAVLVACLGLFGLAAFAAEQRTKEIGIRKVLGASVVDLVVLLSTGFLGLVAVAFLCAVPIAYVAMQQWLQDFAYGIDLGPGMFVWAGVLVVGITLLTVSFQAVKAALSNPVKCLRHE